MSAASYLRNPDGSTRRVETVPAEARVTDRALDSATMKRGRARAITQRYSDIREEPLLPVFPGILWAGKYTVIGGDPGLGKSIVMCELAARLTRGGPVSPYNPQEFDARNVVLCSSEDGAADTLKPRLRVTGADMSRLIDLAGVLNSSGEHEHLNLGEHLRVLDQLLGDTKAAVLALDPVTSFLGRIDNNSGSEVRGIVDPIKRLLEKHGTALLGVLHLNKDSRASAIYRISGSVAMVGAPRMAFGFVRDLSQDSKADRLLLPIKSNLQKEEPGYGLRIVDCEGYPRLEWRTERPDVRIDDALGSRGPTQVQRAVDVLREVLIPGREVPATDIERLCRERGIGKDARREALRELGAKPYKHGGKDGAPPRWTYKVRGQGPQQASPDEFEAPHGEQLAESIRAPLTEAADKLNDDWLET